MADLILFVLCIVLLIIYTHQHMHIIKLQSYTKPCFSDKSQSSGSRQYILTL